MSKTDAELRALVALAEAATPGPWQNGYENRGGSQSVYAAHTEIASAYFGPGVEITEQPETNAAFIAAASPDVVRELVTELLERRKLMAEHQLFTAGEAMKKPEPPFGERP